MRLPLASCLVCLVAAASAAERINHAGRILGPAPTVTAPLRFDTAAADAVLATLQIMPRDSAYNEDVSARPVAANSAAMIARITADLASSRRTLRAFFEMNYALVPDTQARVDVRLVDYPDESDDVVAGTATARYPFPPEQPVETWPRETGSLTLTQWQRDVNGAGGDRHAIVVVPGSGAFWETWQARLTDTGWQASCGARFNMGSNATRPDGWTSGDAAGLAMFPCLVRFDECERGEVEHTCRIVVAKSRRAHIYPATHHASTLTDADLPAMGQRLRLKAGYAIPATWSTHERAVATALKRYGGIVADNGGFFSISATPDSRWPANAFANLATIPIAAFEVVQATGPLEGPRSPGAPTADAGPDRTAVIGEPLALAGTATGTGIAVRWSLYPRAPAPGAVTFATPDAAHTTATFAAPGRYTLLLRVADAVHTPAYDAVIVDVADAPGGLRINFQPGAAPRVDGWLVDSGAAYADRGGGLTYGWVGGDNSTTRDRNAAASADQRWDTLIHLQKDGVARTWRIALSDGSYRVRVVRGDPGYTDQLDHLRVQGVRVADPDGEDHWDDDAVTVTVTGGALSIAPDADARNAKLCFVEITPVAPG